MNLTELNKFLDDRSNRIIEIEVLATFIQQIGDKAPELNASEFEDFFGFLQKIPLSNLIFVQFIAIIGDYNEKNNNLKNWKNINLSNDIKDELLSIRRRYQGARSIICHIETRYPVSNEQQTVKISTILDDAKKIRLILNKIRVENKIPELLTLRTSERYETKSLNALLKKVTE